MQSTTVSGQDHLADVPAEMDEPPENHLFKTEHCIPKPLPQSAYTKSTLPYARRESLLTRQLHSETEHSDEERQYTRGHSTASMWSNPSVASTAELTSDDGRSAPSPAISPPLPPTSLRTALPVVEKPLTSEPRILGLDAIAKDPIEAGLGRKRCITFACGNKEKRQAEISPPPPSLAIVATPTAAPSSPPKRKCALRFVCPSKPVPAAIPPTTTSPVKRIASPAPKHRRSSSSLKTKSASPATSPRLSRKSPVQDKAALPIPKRAPIRPLNDSDDSGAEATKFHEFASSEDEPDEWTQESTCYRNRLCVSDTLKKENVIRRLAEEVEEEAIDEDEDEDDEDEDDGPEDDEHAEDDETTLHDDEDEEEDQESDAGFHSDDEQGFAVSDSEGEDSDNEWWTPGGASTAATSAEHLDLLNKITPRADMQYGSSLASNSSAGLSPHSRQRRPRAFRTHSKSSAVPIDRAPTPDLPDSTDFVCGTLDEDRPQEQAYINRIKEREAAKHPLLPQDIDPTFPTSDPDMDEEDDEDLDDAASDSDDDMMHGSIDSIHGTARPLSPTPRRDDKRSPNRHASPAPTVLRAKSPAPRLRLASPAPRHRSPAPLTRTRTKSPAPKARPARSPAPRARSPAPRKLFGHSPRRLHSPPAHGARMTSPPNTRRASPSTDLPSPHHGLAGRPNTLAITASLPKRPGGFLLSRLGMPSDVDSSDTVDADPNAHRGGRRRGAIDIVKGLEKKKQRRREKLCQKLAAKAAARGEERKKVKPGRGLERMREVGLELQKYKGGTGHIISY